MRVGDTIEAAIWLSGAETDDMKDQYVSEVCDEIDRSCEDEGDTHGPVTFYELRPGDPRVPKVPKNIKGPDVRLFIAECTVLPRPVVKKRGISGDLDRKDREALRKITRVAYARANPGARLTDMECDDYIDELGERVVMRQLRNDRALH